MPRVETHTRRRATAAERTCVVCHKPVQVGEEYHQWKFRFGGIHVQHTSHGYPRRSQLTQSYLADVYAAVETAEDSLGALQLPGWGGMGLAPGDLAPDTLQAIVDDVTSIVQDVATAADEVATQYRDAADAMGAAGESGESAERADTLESYSSDLSSWTSSTELPDPPDGDQPTDWDGLADDDPWRLYREALDGWLDDLRQEAQDALDGLDL